MLAKNLIQNWSLPNRSDERTQLTLRLPFNDYARLHALKKVFPNQSVNDLICDIIKSGLDGIVEDLPTHVYTQRDYEEDRYHGIPDEELGCIGSTYGLRIQYDQAYREILLTNSSDDVEKSKKSPRFVETVAEEQAA